MCRPLGRRIPGLGRARRLSGDRSGRRPGGCCVPDGGAARLADTWFPFGGHLIAASTTPRAPSSRRRGSVTRSSRWAPWPRALRTRSTTRLGLGPLGRPRSEATTGVLLSSLRRLADEEISAQQFAALDAPSCCREAPTRGPVAPRGLRTSAGPMAEPARGHRRLDDRPRAGGRRRRSGMVCTDGRRADGSALGPAFAWVASTYATDALLAELRQATTRISELVAAVRSYSQLDRARQRIDLTEGLDSTLVMLEHNGTRCGSSASTTPTSPDRGLSGRAEPGVDQPDRQRVRRHGRAGMCG